MFGQKKTESESQKDIPVLTMDNYPGKNVEPIGTIFVRFTDAKLLKLPDFQKMIPDVQREAEKLSADAVLGFRFNLISPAVMVAYGTAVHFI